MPTVSVTVVIIPYVPDGRLSSFNHLFKMERRRVRANPFNPPSSEPLSSEFNHVTNSSVYGDHWSPQANVDAFSSSSPAKTDGLHALLKIGSFVKSTGAVQAPKLVPNVGSRPKQVTLSRREARRQHALAAVRDYISQPRLSKTLLQASFSSLIIGSRLRGC
jgi:hypothetical protein